MRTLPQRFHAALALVTALSFASAAPAFGVTISPFTSGWPDATLSLSVPFATYEGSEGPVVFAGRADVTAQLNLSTLPLVGLGATATFVSHDMFQPYFGLGAGLGWRDTPTGDELFVSPTLLAGLRVPLNDTWAARLEASIAPLGGPFLIGLGFELTP